jgi:hypothetical protein
MKNLLPKPDFDTARRADGTTDYTIHAALCQQDTAWRAEQKRLVAAALAAGDNEAAVQFTVERYAYLCPDIQSIAVTEVEPDKFMQRVPASEKFWQCWRETSSVLAADGWRVRKIGGEWEITLHTCGEQLRYYARKGERKVNKYTPKGYAAKRYAGKSHRPPAPDKFDGEQDYRPSRWSLGYEPTPEEDVG